MHGRRAIQLTFRCFRLFPFLTRLIAAVVLAASPHRALTAAAQPEAYVGLGHIAPITALAWSPDGRTLATGSEDGSLRFWDGATGKERVGLYSLDGGRDWLALTPEGYFTASEHGAGVLRYQVGSKSLSGKPLRSVPGVKTHTGAVSET